MRLMHPFHGWHEASSADDIEGMRRNGWVDDDGKAIAAKKAALGLVQPVQEPVQPAQPIKRGPGRPRKV